MKRFAALWISVALIGGVTVAPAAKADPVKPVVAAQTDVSALSAAGASLRSSLASASASGQRERDILGGVRDFYAARGYEPAWMVDGKPSQQMLAMRRRLENAAADGLDPARYESDEFLGSRADAPVAAADIGFSRAVARYVVHLASGSIAPGDVSSVITLTPEMPDVAAALARLSRTAGIAVALKKLEPPHPEYARLKATLRTLRQASGETEQVRIPEGKLLKAGVRDPRVPLLRTRLAVPAGSGEADIYDADLAAAVAAFQASEGLTEDGVAGPRTLGRLNGPDREADIASAIANMERWRWMPRDLGALHVFVNVPEFVVRVVKDGDEIHATRVIVGKASNPTPTFSHAISYMVVNPYWNVPNSIVRKEMIPEIQGNPRAYFSRQGFQVFAQVGGRSYMVDPAMIDWGNVDPRSLRIRQVPSERNALGRIKFMFPNQHSVYLHDTPGKRLFRRDDRALSHGCVRVDDPLGFADALLPYAKPDWNSARLEKLYGGKERRINLDRDVPVHLAYFSMRIEADGTIRRFRDVYGYDQKMQKAAGA